MSSKEQASADAIRDAIRGRAPKGYSEVVAGDVLRVADAIPAADREKADWVNDLAAGAMANPKTAKVHQTTGHLAELLEVFDRTRPPGEA